MNQMNGIIQNIIEEIRAAISKKDSDATFQTKLRLCKATNVADTRSEESNDMLYKKDSDYTCYGKLQRWKATNVFNNNSF